MWKKEENAPITIFLVLILGMWAATFISLRLLQPFSIAFSNDGVVSAGYILYALIGLLFSTPAPFIATFITLRIKEHITIKEFFKRIFYTVEWRKSTIIVFGFCAAALVFAIINGQPTGAKWYMLPLGFIVMIPFVGIAEETGWRGFLQPALEKRFGMFLGTIITWGIWTVWHADLWFDQTSNHYGDSFAGFAINLLIWSISLAAIYKVTKSVFACACYHAFMDAIGAVFDWNGLFDAFPGDTVTNIYRGIILIVSLVIIICSGKNRVEKKRISGCIFAIILILLNVILSVLIPYVNKPKSVQEVFEQIVTMDPDATISVGVYEDGEEELWLYTKDGRQDYQEYRYQIGSITKTFTGALLSKGLVENRINADTHIGDVLNLSDGSYNPTIAELVTHTSGLTTQWEELLDEDPNIILSKEDMLRILGEQRIENKEYHFDYSNFGSALAGMCAARISNPDSTYSEVMTDFIKNDLGLENTDLAMPGDFKNNYPWKISDQIISAGGLTSTVTDLLQYGKVYLGEEDDYEYLKNAVQSAAKVDETYDIGYFWLIDKEKDFFWHNGEVAFQGEKEKEVGYQSFIGISPANNKVVVILVNSIADYEDNALTDLAGYYLMME